jgi:rhodanese-related sulfurtransferase
MAFGNPTPEIDVSSLAAKLNSDEMFVLLDVREPFELDRAKIMDGRLTVAPMSRLSNEGVDALPESVRLQNTEIYVMCHHGVRSANVTRWLVSQGWINVYSIRGGIDAYAREIDETVGVY